MAKCKFCGQGVRVAPVFHPACWKQRADKAAEEFCDGYCRWLTIISGLPTERTRIIRSPALGATALRTGRGNIEQS